MMQESRIYRARMLVVWTALTIAWYFICWMPRAIPGAVKAFFWIDGKLADIETDEGIRPDAGLTFWQCATNYWRFGPWEPDYFKLYEN